jgi:mono/diheme cytochrome c family protein
LTVTLGGSVDAADWPAEDLWYKCKGCHGMDGKANTKIGVKEKIPDLTSPTWQAQMSDEQIRIVISDGSDQNSKMKAYKEIFSQAEIDSLIPYIRGMKATRLR